MQTIDNALKKLSKSKFRSSFHLKAKDIAYIDEKGMDTIKSHAEDFISEKLAPAYPKNDGKQTPMKNLRCLLHSMRALAVAALVLKSGIKCRKARLLLKRSRKKLLNF